MKWEWKCALIKEDKANITGSKKRERQSLCDLRIENGKGDEKGWCGHDDFAASGSALRACSMVRRFFI